MASAGLRIGVVGATGALGAEVLDVLAGSSIRVAEVVPIATQRSLGAEVEFQGDVYPVETGLERLRGLDFVFLCAPSEASLGVAREALRAEVPGIDLSGALSRTPEVPLQIAEFGVAAGDRRAPFVATPSGPALAWALVLRPLEEHAGLVRVVGTVLDSASSIGGVRGTEALMTESVALFNQDELPDPTVFPRSVAFDCAPAVGLPDETGGTPRENEAVADLQRLLGENIRFSITAIQVPTFLGLGSSISVEMQRPVDPHQAEALLAKAPGIELWSGDADGPSVRAAGGREEVLVGRVRGDATLANGLLLWLASDSLRLVAVNAVRLAEARLGFR